MLFEGVNLYKAFTAGWGRRRFLPVLTGADISVEEGESVAIVGRSGVGKTTLALILSGLLKSDSGQVCLDGKPLWMGSQRERREGHKQIQLVWQHPEIAFDPLWAMGRSLLEPFRLHAIPTQDSTLPSLLSQVELDASVLERRPAQLSGGELQRLAIARALALEPHIMILDEPTAMLDAVTQAQIMAMLDTIRQTRGIGHLLITHNLPLAQRFCQRVCHLEDGRIKALDTKGGQSD